MTDANHNSGILKGRAPTPNGVKYALGLLAAMLLAQIVMLTALDQMRVITTRIEDPAVSKAAIDILVGSALMTATPALGALAWSFGAGRRAESGGGFLQWTMSTTTWYVMGLVGTMLFTQALLIGGLQWAGMAYDPATRSAAELWVDVAGSIVMFTLAPAVGAVSWWWYNE